MRKLFDNVKTVISLEPESYTTSTNGTAVVDTQGFDDGMLVVAAGDIGTGAGDLYTLTVKEGDTTASFADTGIAVTFAHNADNTVAVARIPALNTERKRYLRVDLTCSATTIAWEGTALIQMAGAASNPVNND